MELKTIFINFSYRLCLAFSTLLQAVAMMRREQESLKITVVENLGVSVRGKNHMRRFIDDHYVGNDATSKYLMIP